MLTDKILAEWKASACHSGFYLDGPDFLKIVDRLEAAEKVCDVIINTQPSIIPNAMGALFDWLVIRGKDV